MAILAGSPTWFNTTPPGQELVQTKAHRHQLLSETERVRHRTKLKVRTKVDMRSWWSSGSLGGSKCGIGGDTQK